MAKKKIEYHDDIRNEYIKMWTRKNGSVDDHMVDYCMCRLSAVVKLSNGMYYEFNKPSIRTDFPVAEGMIRDMSEALKICDHISKSEQYFLNRNLEVLNHELDLLTKADSVWCTRKRVVNGSELNIANLRVEFSSWESQDGYVKLPASDKKLITESLLKEKEKFEKRLRSYLKRYGLSKVRTWTYWDME